MRRMLAAAAASAGLVLVGVPDTAQACGGFFCSQMPVDQSAEVIVFTVNPDRTVTMVVQIAYQGSAPEFAWILPLAEVPDVESLATFPQLALSALNANTGPQFQFPNDPDCWGGLEFDASANGVPGSRADGGEVIVHIDTVVGPYGVAVVESTDPEALIRWLREHGFRVTSPMEPYIRQYTDSGLKFLALRLTNEATAADIQPFRLTLPGDVPGIPLRMTALAAEPEMGILVFIFGDRRYGPANWPEVFVDDADIVWRPNTWPLQTNWSALVAGAVDEAGGQGFLTELAEPLAPYRDIVANGGASTDEQIAARDALLELMGTHQYVTRLYTRLSAEEMTLDPVFRRSPGADVGRLHMLPRYVGGRDMCDYSYYGYPGGADTTSPCEFASCGAGGLCREAMLEDGSVRAGCACVPGTTARTTLDPTGRASVVCQDMRMSFINPGDRETPEATPLPDPCVGYDCGAGGECVPMNMTPTCRCTTGFVAVGSFLETGARETRCVAPSVRVPSTFYNRRLPALPVDLPGGRIVETPPPLVAAGGGCSAANGGSGAPFAVAAIALAGLFAARRRAA